MPAWVPVPPLIGIDVRSDSDAGSDTVTGVFWKLYCRCIRHEILEIQIARPTESPLVPRRPKQGCPALHPVRDSNRSGDRIFPASAETGRRRMRRLRGCDPRPLPFEQRRLRTIHSRHRRSFVIGRTGWCGSSLPVNPASKKPGSSPKGTIYGSRTLPQSGFHWRYPRSTQDKSSPESRAFEPGRLFSEAKHTER